MRDERKKKLKKIALIFFLVLALAILTILAFKLITGFVINQIQINPVNIDCADENSLKQFIGNLKHRYFTFSNNNLDREVKEKFFCVNKIETKLQFPNKAFVNIYGREPSFLAKFVDISVEINPLISLPTDYKEATESSMAAVPLRIIENNLNVIKDASSSSVFYVDKEGVLFKETNDSSPALPLITILGKSYQIGERIDFELVKKILNFLDGLRKVEVFENNLFVIGEKLIVGDKPRIIFSLTKEPEYQVASLQLILTQAKMSSDQDKTGIDRLEAVDLRFNKPVIVFTKKK